PNIIQIHTNANANQTRGHGFNEPPLPPKEGSSQNHNNSGQTQHETLPPDKTYDNENNNGYDDIAMSGVVCKLNVSGSDKQDDIYPDIPITHPWGPDWETYFVPSLIDYRKFLAN